jgi:hypothetical protein
MKKLISILSVITLLAIGAVEAKATCYSIPAIVPYAGYTIGGTFCYTQNSMSFNGTAAANGQTYAIVAAASVSGSGVNLTLSGSVTVTLNGKIVKQLSIHEGIPSGEIAAIEAFLAKVLSQLPTL